MRTFFLAALSLLLVACSEPSVNTGNTRDRLDLAAFEGRWVVVNYWAKWCKPCIKEIPELNALESTYPQVAVLGVNYDGAQGPELDQQLQDLGVAFPTILQDPSAMFGIRLPSVLPTTLILNPSGELVHTLVGPQTLESLALATGQAAMPEAGPTSGDLIEEN